MLDHVRHVLAGKGVEDEDAGHDHHRQAERAARRLEEQQDANGAGDEIERGRLAGPAGKLDIEEKQIGACKGAGDRQHPVEQRHAIAGRGFQRRIGEEGQEQREAEMDCARFGVVEDAEAEHERQRRSVPELEKRPGDRNPEQDSTDCPARMPAARIGLRDQLFENFEIDASRLLLRFAHDASRCGCRRRVPLEPAGRRQVAKLTSASPFPCNTFPRPDAAAPNFRPRPSFADRDWRRPDAAT